MHIIRDINSRYWQECMGLHTLIFLYTGYWPLVKDEKNLYLKFSRCLPFLCVGYMAVTLMIALYDLTFKLHDYVLLAESLSYIFSSSQALLISIIATVKIKVTVQTFAVLEELTGLITEDHEKQIFKQRRHMSIWFTIINIFIWCGYALIFSIKPLLEAERRYPLHVNLPLESPLFEIFYTGCVFSGLLSTVIMSIFDSIFTCLFIYFTGYLKMLQYRLEHIRELSLKSLIEEMHPGPATELKEILAICNSVDTSTNSLSVVDRASQNVNDAAGKVKETQEAFNVGLCTRGIQNDQAILPISDVSLDNRVLYIESLEQDSELMVKEDTDGGKDKQLEMETVPQMRANVYKRDNIQDKMRRRLAWENVMEVYAHPAAKVKQGKEKISGELSTVSAQGDPVISLISDANQENCVVYIESSDNEEEEKVLAETTGGSRQESELEHRPEINPDVNKRDLEAAMGRRLRECVQMHQVLIRAVNAEIKRIDYVLFLTLALGAISICLTMFLTTMVPFGSVDMFLWCGYLALALEQQFVYCWISSELNEQSVRVSDALYFSDWTEASPAYKRSMLIMMTRAVKPVEISSMAFITLRMELFTEVIKSAYSYFNVVKNLQKAK